MANVHYTVEEEEDEEELYNGKAVLEIKAKWYSELNNTLENFVHVDFSHLDCFIVQLPPVSIHVASMLPIQEAIDVRMVAAKKILDVLYPLKGSSMCALGVQFDLVVSSFYQIDDNVLRDYKFEMKRFVDSYAEMLAMEMDDDDNMSTLYEFLHGDHIYMCVELLSY